MATKESKMKTNPAEVASTSTSTSISNNNLKNVEKPRKEKAKNVPAQEKAAMKKKSDVFDPVELL